MIDTLTNSTGSGHAYTSRRTSHNRRGLPRGDRKQRNGVIAVVDDGGHLISLERMDGTQKGSVRVAEQKARTAIMFKRPTKAFEDMVLQGRPVMMTMPEVICLEGGLPLLRDGVYLGAIGVSGVKPSEDGIVAAAGASALGA